jgi:hypothetical protein
MVQTTTSRWVLVWKDASGDPARGVYATADSAAEAVACVRRLLAGSTWTPDDAEEFGSADTVPAFDALVRDELAGEAERGVMAVTERLEFRCDEGTLEIVRER